MLFLDFSQVGGDSRTAEARFERYGCKVLDDFIDMYGKYYTLDTIRQVKDSTTFAEKLTSVCLKARTLGYQLYLIIDEYDNFTNNILNNEGEGTYHELTHATGFYRDVFKLFKPNFTRILMMGVQPVTLDNHRLDIIHRIAGDGYVLGSLNASFPAESMMDDDNFISMLYYYGMLTITGIYGARLKLGIPNNNVRKQYYEYIIEEYNRIAHIEIPQG